MLFPVNLEQFFGTLVGDSGPWTGRQLGKAGILFRHVPATHQFHGGGSGQVSAARHL